MPVAIEITCQRCGGRVFEERDIFGKRIFCLQCSAEHDRHGNLIPHPMAGLHDNLHEPDLIIRGRHYGRKN